MPLKPADWHQRFSLQAEWTSNTRQFLFSLAGVIDSNKVLDVGCGTGVLTRQLSGSGVQHPVGIDINPQFIEFATTRVHNGQFSIANAHFLPFTKNTFDCSFCHYVLMWVSDPLAILNQMKRVTKPGKAVLALAEPDYGGRIDHPRKLEVINQWQSKALRHQGADPYFGRKLKGLFHKAGLVEIEVGVIGAQWKKKPSRQELSSEWSIIQHDLSTLDKETSEFSQNSEVIKDLDFAAWASGERILYVPTFYALGRVPT